MTDKTDNPLTREREDFAKRVLEEGPRLGLEDTFTFGCHPGVSCFNYCCANVNIVLTPYDIIRMSRALHLSTTDFLAQHTLVPFTENQRLPIVFLRMNDDDKKTCPFVTKAGCSIYKDRPWPCRMYPIGEATPYDPSTQGEAFFFLVEEDHCQGHREKKTWKIKEWIQDQGAVAYGREGVDFRELLAHPYFQTNLLEPARMEMFYMACYDLDKFRSFVFESKFLQRFKVAPDLVEKVRSDDMEALKFAFRWLRFALFGELTLEVDPSLLSSREREMLEKRKTRD